jgi:hypothetical protein
MFEVVTFDALFAYSLVLISLVALVIRANRVGGRSLIGRPTSHTTVRTVRYTAVR